MIKLIFKNDKEVKVLGCSTCFAYVEVGGLYKLQGSKYYLFVLKMELYKGNIVFTLGGMYPSIITSRSKEAWLYLRRIPLKKIECPFAQTHIGVNPFDEIPKNSDLYEIYRKEFYEFMLIRSHPIITTRGDTLLTQYLKDRR